MKAFLGAFDASFAFASNLKALRAFILAGGSSKRRHSMTEFAITLSGIDFADTRWLGFIKSVLYLMMMQSSSELRRADVALAYSAAEGDPMAAAALADPGQPQLHFNACFEYIEDIVESEGAWQRVCVSVVTTAAALQRC